MTAETRIREGCGLRRISPTVGTGFAARWTAPWPAACLPTGGHVQSGQWCQTSQDVPRSGTAQQGTSRHQRHSLCAPRVHWLPYQWDQGTEMFSFPRTLGTHCSAAGKINLGLTQSFSKTGISEDIFHSPGTAASLQKSTTPLGTYVAGTKH